MIPTPGATATNSGARSSRAGARPAETCWRPGGYTNAAVTRTSRRMVNSGDLRGLRAETGSASANAPGMNRRCARGLGNRFRVTETRLVERFSGTWVGLEPLENRCALPEATFAVPPCWRSGFSGAWP